MAGSPVGISISAKGGLIGAVGEPYVAVSAEIVQDTQGGCEQLRRRVRHGAAQLTDGERYVRPRVPATVQQRTHQ